MLQRGDKGELDTLARLVASRRVGGGVQTGHDRPGNRFQPGERGILLANPPDVMKGRTVIHRNEPLRASLSGFQAGVGGDSVEPGSNRASLFEPFESAPRTDERFLECILGVLD